MNIVSKISLYDFLTMLVSGFLLLTLFIPFPTTNSGWWVFLIASYMVGIVYHRLIEYLRSCKCYCLKKIVSCFKKVGPEFNTCLKLFLKKIKFRFLTIMTSNYVESIRKAKSGSKQEGDLDEYYKAYYQIMREPCFGSISVLEAQEAFLRDLSPLILVYSIIILFQKSIPILNLLNCTVCNCCCHCLCFHCEMTPCMVWFLLLLWSLVRFARYRTQMKV